MGNIHIHTQPSEPGPPEQLCEPFLMAQGQMWHWRTSKSHGSLAKGSNKAAVMDWKQKALMVLAKQRTLTRKGGLSETPNPGFAAIAHVKSWAPAQTKAPPAPVAFLIHKFVTSVWLTVWGNC